MRFWDSSAVVPLCLIEPNTQVLKSLLKKDGMIAVWWGTPVECFSAFARLRREGAIDRDEE